MLCGALAAGLAHAQGVDPTSQQNVMPQASAPTGKAAETQRPQLFSRMMANPADLDTAFAYAALSAQLGDLEGAISTLERMLIFAPGLPRLQFELGVLYYRLGAFETAATYLNAVSAASGVPEEIKSQVDLYLGAIEQRSSGTTRGGVVTIGVRAQSNANAGPSSPIINLNGLDFVLNPGALGKPDVNGFATVNLGASFDLQNQGDRFDANLSAYGALYRNETHLNTGIVEARVGPTFNLQRFEIDNATLGFYGLAGGAILSGDPYLASLGLGTALTAVLDARSRVVLKLEGREEVFFNSAMRPNASLRSGERYSGAATYEYQLTPDFGVFGTFTAERRFAQRGYLTTWQAGASIGARVEFASPIPMLDDPWSLSLSAGVLRQVADAPDPVFSATTPETLDQYFVQGALTVPLQHGFALQTTAGYNVSKSNYALSNYDNFSGSVGLSKGF